MAPAAASPAAPPILGAGVSARLTRSEPAAKLAPSLPARQDVPGCLVLQPCRALMIDASEDEESAPCPASTVFFPDNQGLHYPVTSAIF